MFAQTCQSCLRKHDFRVDFDPYEQQKTEIISARAAKNRVLTDQREKVLRMLLNGSMYLLTHQREKVLWMLLNGSMYLERCFS